MEAISDYGYDVQCSIFSKSMGTCCPYMSLDGSKLCVRHLKRVLERFYRTDDARNFDKYSCNGKYLEFVQIDEDEDLLQSAVYYGKYHIVELLMTKYRRIYDLNNIVYGSETPLSLAIMKFDPRMVGLLLNHGARTLIEDFYNIKETALEIAVRSFRHELPYILSSDVFDEGNDCDDCRERNDTNCFQDLSRKIRVIRILIDYEMKKSGEISGQHNLLGYAITMTKSLDVVKEYVIRGKVDPTEGLGSAVANNYYEIAKYLLEQGADPNTQHGYVRKSYMTETAIEKSYFDMLELLISKGANINTEDARGLSPLYYAALKFDIDLVEKLVSYGADIDKLNKDGLTLQEQLRQSGRLNYGMEWMMYRDEENDPVVIRIKQLLKFDGESEARRTAGKSENIIVVGKNRKRRGSKR